MGIENRIGFTRDLCPVGIAHCQYAGFLAAGVADSFQGVCGFAGLGDGQHEGVWTEDGVAVAEFGGEFDFYGDACPVLDGVFGEEP